MTMPADGPAPPNHRKPDQRFPKSARLRVSPEFDRVFQSKHYAADGVLVVCAARNELNVTRLGLSVSRKVGNAVVRAKWKRRIREAFRTQRSELPRGLDLVVRPKRGAVCDYAMIVRSLQKLCQRLDRSIPTEPAGG